MGDNEEGEETSKTLSEEGEESAARGTEWEVVSLTASAYNAAPGPVELAFVDNGNSETYGETSHALFMSGHFVFPPSQHENLPVETNSSEIKKEHVDEDVVAEIGIQEGRGRSSGKEEETLDFKGLNVPDEFAGISFLREKDKKLSVAGKEFEEGTTLDGLTSPDKVNPSKVESIYDAAKYSLDGETALGGSNPYGENTAIPGLTEPSGQCLDNISQSPRSVKDDKFDVSDLPCGAWWKRRAASMYSHAKEANAFWSILIAATVTGLVLLGQRWQHERWQALQQKWQLSVNDQKMGRITGPISRLKDVIVGSSQRRGSFIRSSSSTDS